MLYMQYNSEEKVSSFSRVRVDHRMHGFIDGLSSRPFQQIHLSGRGIYVVLKKIIPTTGAL